MTTLPRLQRCAKTRIEKATNPYIAKTAAGVAHYGGVQLCGGIHTCPVCSPRIRQERANDIDQAAQHWISEHGAGSIMLLTLTTRHHLGEALAELLATVRASFGALVSGRAWQTDKAGYGMEHYIVAHDATVGKNGWHPHFHILLFGGRALDDLTLHSLATRLHERWAHAITLRGHAAPSRAHGVSLERARNRADVTRYVCQVIAGGEDEARTVPVALEMARGDLKTSRHEGQRTHWDVARDLTGRRAADGEWTPAHDAADARDLALWREWETATKGMRAIRWSKGLRKAVDMAAEKTDDEIVSEEIGGDTVYTFSDTDTWKAVCETRGARQAILRAAETETVQGVAWLVEETLRAWRARRLAQGINQAPPVVAVRRKARNPGTHASIIRRTRGLDPEQTTT